ncbi:glycosyltransferase family 2 protein [Endozoicomonas sp. SESOKO3]|uniref:glycosyltransferase family 2 protein n=1 Tax=Endozoicomonas sp. SESOKO3 TaxID=2828744 RepID=UPI00214975ED|nr:glycosyltransferase family 2 protein [Endozoicomonas sp. SESOKO3]
MNIQEDLISVIIPVFNSEPYIEDCLFSIISQTYKNIEILVINDGSTDKTKDIILKIKDQDKRIKYLEQENSGVSKARNKGLSIALGSYIALIDSDDICYPFRLEEQINHMKSKNIDICGSWIKEFNTKKNKIKSYPDKDNELKFNYFFFGKTIPCPTVMMRAESIKNLRFDSSLDFAEDYDFLMRTITENRCQLGAIKKPLVKYRVHENQHSKKLVKKNKYTLTNSIKNNSKKHNYLFEEDEINLHFEAIKNKHKISRDEFEEYKHTLEKLYNFVSIFCDCRRNFSCFLYQLIKNNPEIKNDIKDWAYKKGYKIPSIITMAPYDLFLKATNQKY